MKKDVWLTISSQQQFAGCDEENIDLQTAATVQARRKILHRIRAESELTGLEYTKTTPSSWTAKRLLSSARVRFPPHAVR